MNITTIKEGYIELANAIILQAVKDYRKALRKLAEYPDNYMARAIKSQAEKFFYSDWYQMLTEIDSVLLIKKLNDEVIR